MATLKSTGAPRAAQSLARGNPKSTSADASPKNGVCIEARRATARQVLAAERAIAGTWLDSLEAMFANKQLPEYFIKRHFPSGPYAENDAWAGARRDTDLLLAGRRVPARYPDVGASGRLSGELVYYVRDRKGEVVAQGRPSEVLITPGIAKCLSARQLQFFAAALAQEARSVQGEAS